MRTIGTHSSHLFRFYTDRQSWIIQLHSNKKHLRRFIRACTSKYAQVLFINPNCLDIFTYLSFILFYIPTDEQCSPLPAFSSREGLHKTKSLAFARLHIYPRHDQMPIENRIKVRNEAQEMKRTCFCCTRQQFKPSVYQYRSAEHITVLTPATYQTRSLQVTLLILYDGISHLEACFTLRCLQRLSLPYAATQLCPWQDN